MAWRNLLIVLGAIWIVSLAVGFGIMAHEAYTPVKTSSQPAVFPGHSSINLSLRSPTLLLFVHPLCPCTRASLYELQSLLAETPTKVFVVVVFSIPAGLPNDWKSAYLWKAATAMSDVQVMEDVNGVEARRFDVTGSGDCLLYSRSGSLLFSGGITGARGHEGENLGRLAVLSWIKEGRAKISRTPVFGCSLQ